ncbi:MAG TPA: ribosomal protein S18-alanine N-acetyltransferase [Gemmatimonadaceae bacterium]|nr:ribosomal protein S18-alanine N-acetyltransferase [Gemmatimonadaceae bacterium]
MIDRLRPAREEDITDIARIERSSFADPWSEESFRRIMGGHSAIFQVLVLGREKVVAGYIIAFVIGPDAELLNVAVDPAFRRRGLAGQMLDAVLIQLGSNGVRTAFLEVRESNRAARALYGSRDFQEIGRRRNYYRRPVEDALVMRRLLDVAADDEKESAGSFADR